MAALTTPRCLVCEVAARPFADVVRFGRCNFGAETFFFLFVLFLVVLLGALADDFAAAATRFGFEPPALVFTAPVFRLETLTALVDLAAVLLVARAGLLILADTFASLLFVVALDFDNRLVAFARRLDDFFGVFFRADMADLLPKPNASNLR